MPRGGVSQCTNDIEIAIENSMTSILEGNAAAANIDCTGNFKLAIGSIGQCTNDC